MVVTTNYFTKGAASLAISNNVKLIDRKKLEEWLNQYQIWIIAFNLKSYL